MPKARIYQPASSAMQAGPCSDGKWILEFEPGAAKTVEPLMGWVSASDAYSQVRLNFQNCEQAVAFAKKKGLTYHVVAPNVRRFKIKNYADNFSYR